ncbi:hypothetical protein [Methanoculleus chikugoensis]|uniref:hypothetical protein n=1 Tax=Methanoculleus chikugoensis TaxID=118126 RepID=UPI000B190F40|nr:hypothetical protein [Methanoculleus chikugoensis]
MNVIVQPQKGTYKLLFVEGGRVEGSGFVDLTATPKGQRPPKNFKMRRRGKQLKPTPPTRDLIALLRRSSVLLAAKSPEFESFLADLQIPASRINICRFCQLEDRFVPVDRATGVRYGGEWICMECAKREMRRELGYLGEVRRLGARPPGETPCPGPRPRPGAGVGGARAPPRPEADAL